MSALLKEFTAYIESPRVPSHTLDPESVSRLLSLATPIAADIGQVLTRQFTTSAYPRPPCRGRGPISDPTRGSERGP